MVAVVIPAAGSGSRLGGQPKQLRIMGNAPLLFHTAQAFDHHPQVTHLVIPGSEQSLDVVKEILMPLQKPCHVVTGGATRQESVMAGLDEISSSTSVVLIHDAARPFITQRVITRVIESTLKHGAAAAAVPVSDTVRYGEHDRFTKTISRNGLYSMQTPQGFKYELLMDAFRQRKFSNATDDVEVMQQAGYDVCIVEGDPRNIKITTKFDWDWANQMWHNQVITTP